MPPSSRRLALVLPEFDFESALSRRLPALERLIAYSRDGLDATASSQEYEPWQSELFRIVGDDAGAPPASAPTTWFGVTGERDAATFLHADPVRLEMSADGLILRVTQQWANSELVAAGKLFDEHLSQMNMHWRVVGGRAFIRSESPLSARTMSPRHAADRSLRDSLPDGPSAPELKRLMTELQMLLHEKFAAPSAPNAVWLWGVGSLDRHNAESVPRESELPRAWANDGFARGLYAARGASDRCLSLPQLPGDASAHSLDDILGARCDRMLVVARETSVEQFERNWFAPALSAIDDGRVDEVELCLDGHAIVAQRSWLRRLFSRPRALAELGPGARS